MEKNTKTAILVGGIVLALPVLLGFGASTKKTTPKKTTPKKTKTSKPKRPDGHPAPFGSQCYPEEEGGAGAYDKAYWDAGNTATERARIFEALKPLDTKLQRTATQ